MVFTNYKFKVGDNVIVNNIPGKIIEMTALVMRIQTDVGKITIPNSAIASGGVIITVFGNMKAGRKQTALTARRPSNHSIHERARHTLKN